MIDAKRDLANLLRRQVREKQTAAKLLTITPSQMKAARGLLDWSQSKLAAVVGITDATIRGFEVSRTMLSDATLAKVHQAFNDVGVILVKDGVIRNGEGVMMRQDANSLVVGQSKDPSV